MFDFLLPYAATDLQSTFSGVYSGVSLFSPMGVGAQTFLLTHHLDQLSSTLWPSLRKTLTFHVSF